MEKVPGCWEHMSMFWGALKEAQCNKLNVANIWLDIANAYGSIPHKQIFFALERYGVHKHWMSLIKAYYSRIYSNFFSSSAPSSWHQHFKGIYRLHIIHHLFLIWNQCHHRICNIVKGILFHILQKSFPTFSLSFHWWYELSLMSFSVAGAKDLLSRCTTALTWTSMSYMGT